MQSGVAEEVYVRNWAEVATVRVKASTGLHRRVNADALEELKQ